MNRRYIYIISTLILLIPLIFVLISIFAEEGDKSIQDLLRINTYIFIVTFFYILYRYGISTVFQRKEFKIIGSNYLVNRKNLRDIYNSI